MSGKAHKIYEALVKGAENGLSDDELFQHVLEECPKATSKKIVKASLFALSDPDLKDGNILHVIYALAIKHRLDPWVKGDGDIEPSEAAPQMKKARKGEKAAMAAQT